MSCARSAWEKLKTLVTGWGPKLEKENYFMLIGFKTSSIYIIKMQIDTLQHTDTVSSIFRETEWAGVQRLVAPYAHTYIHTRGENAISSPVWPANDFPHLLQSDVFQQHKDRSHLIGEPELPKEHITWCWLHKMRHDSSRKKKNPVNRHFPCSLVFKLFSEMLKQNTKMSSVLKMCVDWQVLLAKLGQKEKWNTSTKIIY